MLIMNQVLGFGLATVEIEFTPRTRFFQSEDFQYLVHQAANIRRWLWCSKAIGF